MFRELAYRLVRYLFLFMGELILGCIVMFVYTLLTDGGEHSENVNENYFNIAVISACIILHIFWVFTYADGKRIWQVVCAIVSGLMLPFTFFLSDRIRIHSNILFMSIILFAPIVFWELINMSKLLSIQRD
jgi:hypothetical protein